MQYKIFLLIFIISITVNAQGVNFTSSNLPIIVIDTDGIPIPDEPKIHGLMGIIYNGTGEINYITDPFNHYDGHIGIEIRGHSSQSFPKKQYGLETRDSLGGNNNVSIFGMPSENDWILYAPYSDKSLIRNVLAYKIGNSMGWYAPRTKFCEVVLNDEYIGLYVFMEKIKKDNNRVNISSPDSTNLSGGYILEIEWWDRLDTSDIYFVSNIIGRPYVIKYPNSEDLTNNQITWIHSYINEFESNLYSVYFNNPDSGYIQYINLPSWIDYFIVNEAFRNNDVFFSSTYLYKDKDEKLNAGPIWDYNIAMGNIDYNDNWLTEGWWLTENQWSGRLLEDSNLIKTYKIRWNELRSQQLSTNNIDYLIDSFINLIMEAQERNFQRWPILGHYIWPNYYVGETYEDEILYLRQWLEDRFLWIDSQFDISGYSFPVINEINYHSANNFNSEDWVELYNPDSISIDISNWIFKDENDDHLYIIPENTFIYPNNYLILCRDTIAFKQHYPQILTYIGNFDFGLSNGGELIRLFDCNGCLIDYIDYDDSPPWPTEPDGNGTTLELRTLPRGNFHVSNWVSSVLHGTPGEINSIVVAVHPIKVTEKVDFYLEQNYPNPFNPTTTIRYSLLNKSKVVLKIYNILGQEIKILINEIQFPGIKSIIWDGRDQQGKCVSNGVYIYNLEVNGLVQSLKMLLIK